MTDDEAIELMEKIVNDTLDKVKATDLSNTDKAHMRETIAQVILLQNFSIFFGASEELLETIEDEIDQFIEALVAKVQQFTR